MVILCVSIFISAIFLALSVHLADHEFKENIALQTKHLSDAFTQQLWLFDLNSTEKLSNLALDSPDIKGLRLMDHNRKILINKGSFPGTSVIIKEELRYGGEKLVGYLEFSFVNTSWKKQKNFILLTGFGILVVTIITTFLAITFLLRRHLARPLKDLQQDMSMLADGKFRHSNLSDQKTEIQNIIDVFNKMASSLAQREKDQSKAEQESKESQDRYISLFNGSKDSIFTTTKEGAFIDINPAMLNLTGYTREELFNIKAIDTYEHHDDRAKFQKTIEAEGSVDDYQLNLVTKDGKVKNCLMSASLWTSDSEEILGYQGIIRDITEQKQLENQISQSQKMEAIGTLAGGIAHDFNNILSVIIGYADLAKEDAPPGSHLSSDLDNVIVASNRAKDLVKQILAFSRQTTINPIPLQLQSLIKETLKMLRSSIPTTIEINDDIDSRCGSVLADPTQVHQILMNLCTNANHAMEETGGTLSIALKNVQIGKENQQPSLKIEPGEYIEMTVADTGSGIGPDIIEKIFDPYFTTKEIGRGTGMGLAIIHGIIADYGGAITVESDLGRGTSFHVYFPVVDQEESPLVKDSVEFSQGNEHVLFIDDEELLAELGQAMLERLGYQVTVRRSSLEALETFQNNPHSFDVIITDQTMPGMTGSDLARLMLQVRPDIPIILCTGYSNLIDEETAKSFGIKEFALKPLTTGLISSLLRKVLNRPE
ncbi:MAG: PAS domain S-box protein [Thermodesulfobacteriota bacterium]